jgi:hypothetical protein
LKTLTLPPQQSGASAPPPSQMKNEDEESRHEEMLIGSIRHVHRRIPKGIQMLRLDRKLKPILDARRAAKEKDPKAWSNPRGKAKERQ